MSQSPEATGQTRGSTATDASQLLGLSKRPARVVLGLFMVSNVLYTFATLDVVKSPWPPIAALIIVNLAACVLVLDRPDPFPVGLSLAVVAAVTVSTLLVAFQLPDAGPVGRAGWHLGSNTWLLFFLALRRRPGFAWLGYGAMAAGTLWWTTSVGRGVSDGLTLLDAHAAILFSASIFEVNLRRTARAINALERRALGAAVEAVQDATSAQIRQRRVEELRDSALPLLERLAAEGPPTNQADKRFYASTEAKLRDGVRGRNLINPAIVEAVAGARRRGVDVLLLDDRGETLESGQAMLRLTDAVVTELNAARSGSVTVRLAPKGRPVAVSIVSTGGARGRVDLDVDGRALNLENEARPEGFEPPTF